MYNGGFGYGGGYGGGQGGMEMYMIICCCICCLCIACVVGGWYSNVFCKMNSSLGRSCKEPEPAPAPEVIEPPAPATDETASGALTACSEAWNRAPRSNKDPRPAIQAQACQGQTRTLGRDCYFWKVEPDKLTGMARWMRIPDPDDPGKADMRTGASCQPSVRCKPMIDPATLEQYTDGNPAALLDQCAAIGPTATNEAAAIRELTARANRKIKQWSGTSAWSNQNSDIWYRTMKRFIGQRDLSPYYDNTLKAVENFQKKIGTTNLRKATLAYALEAAVRAPTNNAQWIVDVTNKFLNTIALSARRASTSYEGAYVSYLRSFFRSMTPWETTIDNVYKYNL